MGLGNRHSQHVFSQTSAANAPRSTFDRSFNVKDTMSFDLLNPIFVDEILPGDTCNVSLSCFVRLATSLVPVMDNVYMDFFFFFVPNRLVWNNWEKFCGARDNPADSISYTIPQVTFTNSVIAGSLQEKMGLPLGAGSQSVNTLPFRAYNLIWNEWFRAGDTQNSVVVDLDDGPDTLSDYTLLSRNKRPDYFTSCLSAPQKGTAINLLPDVAPVTLSSTTGVSQFIRRKDTHALIGGAAGTGADANSIYATDGGTQAVLDPNGTMVLAATAAGTINQLRTAFQVQGYLELMNRGGQRYVEILLSEFNVTSPDFRLQRPEYLGGGSTMVNSHVVPQTAPTSGSSYRGDLSAFSTASSSGGIGFTKSFTEHGYVIGLACTRADITYQNGINKMWTRSTNYDVFHPKFQEIGEQSVLYRELYADGTATDATVFGYQERYAEYKYKPSEIHGFYRSNATSTIDYWHLAEDLNSAPTLEDFTSSNTPITRTMANSAAPQILFDGFFRYKHSRVMATYSVPAGLGRF